VSLLRYFHTVRHLRPVQIGGRLWFRMHRPRPDLRPAPARRIPTAWKKWLWRSPLMDGAGRCIFLNEAHEVRTAADWDDAARSKLWRYHLHYFDDLAARGADERSGIHRELIERWIRENPPGTGTGWEPYPTSLRIVNWTKWAMASPQPDAGRLPSAVIDSLAAQTRWLQDRLEIHLQGNHLWANAKALVFAGAFFAGREADKWRRAGIALLAREFAEQILPDGGHYERSPMYHAIVLGDILDLINLAGAVPGAVPPELESHLRDGATRMFRWLRVMTHPDGRIAFFNDAAFGIAPEYRELRAYAKILALAVDDRPELGTVELLAESGFARLQSARAVVLCDVGSIGPTHQPAHAHAQSLSFELSVDGGRVAVNTGISTYETTAERLGQRGTAAHNTVEVDGADSSEVWSAFRVARRARAFGVAVAQEGQTWSVRAAHNGYRRLPGRVIHVRSWTLDPNGLSVSDRLEGRCRDAVGYIHIHPEVLISADSSVEPRSFRLRRTGGEGDILISFTGAREVGGAPSFWHPEFGLARANTTLVAEFRGDRLTTRFDWR